MTSCLAYGLHNPWGQSTRSTRLLVDRSTLTPPTGGENTCGKRGHSAKDKEKCSQTCRMCHEHMVVIGDGNSYEHDCLYIIEEYDPRSSKQQFHSVSRSKYTAPVTPRTRPSCFTSAHGHMLQYPSYTPQTQPQGPSSPPNPPSA